MAKKKRNKEERKVQRIQAKRDRKWEGKTESAFKEEQAADLEKVKAADASYKASKKAKKDTEKAQRRGQGSEIKKSAVTPSEVPVSQEPRVMNISVDPETGEQSETQYRNIADYTRNNPEPKNVIPTISGNAPVPETVKQVSQNQPTFNPKKVEEAVNNVGEAVSNVSKEVEKQDYALNLQEQEIARKEGEEPRGVAEGHDRGKTAREAAESGYGDYEYPEVDYQKMGEDFRTALAAAKASAPAAAIENMGIEHYYPPQKDFITANFTGSYIGSRQLVAGTGALFPVGLLDARNRANEEKAKAKAEKEEKFWELSSTSPQYDERYKDVGMDILDKYYTLSGGNLDELMNGKSRLSLQFRREMYDYDSRGKHLVEVMTNIKSVLGIGEDGKAASDWANKYVPPHMIDKMQKVLEGTQDMTAFFEGKAVGDKEMREVSNYIRSYQNFTPLANKQLELLKGQADKMPLRQDIDWTNPVNAANLEEAVTRAGSTRDWTAYTQVVGEYFDLGRVKEIVEEMHRTNRLWEGESSTEREQIMQDEMRYMMSMLGTKIDIEQEFKATNALGWERLKLNWDKWSTMKQWRKDDLETMYEGVNREMNEQNFQNDIINAYNSDKDPKARSKAIELIYQKYGKTVDATGGYASMLLPSKGITVHSVDPKELQVIGRDGKQRNITTELGNIRKEFYGRKDSDDKFVEGNAEYDSMLSQINELKQVTQLGHTPIPMNVGKTTVTPSVYDAATSRMSPLETWKGDIDPSMLTNTVHLGGAIGINTGKKDMNRNSTNYGKDIYRPSQFQFVTNHNIENDATRRILSGMGEKAEAVGWSKEYWESTIQNNAGGSGQTQNEVYEFNSQNK
jgi:hypothetical protein